MKNTYMKKLAVTCVATIALIGPQHSSAESTTGDRVASSIWGHEQSYEIAINDIGLENNFLNNWIFTGETLQFPQLLALQLTKPELDKPNKGLETPTVSSSNEVDNSLSQKVEAKNSKGKADLTDALNAIDFPQLQNNVAEIINEAIGNSINISPIYLATPSSETKIETPEKELEKPTVSIPDEEKEQETSADQISNEEKAPETPAVSLSNEEKDLLARLVEAEAKGEVYEGKVAVATVVLNRVDSPEFPNSVTEVINEKVGNAYAFSPVQNHEINKPASDEAKQAVDEALTREDRLNDSIYFYNPEIATDQWIRTREVVKTIDHHVFAI